jgi:UDP-GlcNAc:undecaprenyl-phosphate/decaprenyl-phosphate GlcNAc-1-phosphate transferase
VREYLLTLAVAATVTYLSLAPVRAFAIRFGFVHELRDRDVHRTPVPRLGGVAMLIGLGAALLVARDLPLLSRVFDTGAGTWKAVASGAVIICGLGVIDDRWGLDALTKLTGQALAGAVMALQGVQLYYFPWPGQSTFVLDQLTGTLLTVVIVLVTVNAVNVVDGLDGLATGIVGIAATATFIYAYVLSVQNHIERAVPAALVTAILAGLCLGFLPHNIFPARIFMGDSGSMLLGLLLAAGVVLLTGNFDPSLTSGLDAVPLFLPVILPFAVIAVPFLDLSLAVVRRTRAGRSPFEADMQHLHHRLLLLGHSQTRAVFLMYAVTAIIAFGAVALALVPAVWAGIVVAVGVAALVVFAVWPPGRRRRTAKLTSPTPNPR